MSIPHPAKLPDQNEPVKVQRIAGARAILKTICKMAPKHRIHLTGWVWDLGQGMDHNFSHRLDLLTMQSSVKEYFSDLDLTNYPSQVVTPNVDQKISRMLTRLQGTTDPDLPAAGQAGPGIPD